MIAAPHCTGCTGDLYPLRSAAHEPGGFIGNADKEFQVSEARDTRIRFAGMTPNHPQRRARRDVFGRAFAACVMSNMHIRVSATICS
jgi:hypothetical protein